MFKDSVGNRVWILFGVIGLVLCVLSAYKFSGQFPSHFLRFVEVQSLNQLDKPMSCGAIQALESQRVPVNTGPEVWRFGRMGGLSIQACNAGKLSFITDRKTVQNTPSRWEVFINDQFLTSGLVGNKRESIEINIKRPGIISLIFSNAYNARDNVKKRRTLYFEEVQFIEKK